MNRIKGLILKDLLELKNYKKNFITSILIYLMIIFLNKENFNIAYFAAYMMVFLFGSYAMATFSYDEKNQTDRYLLTLPNSKKDIVKAKYIFIILSVLIGAVVSIILNIIFKLTNVIEMFDITEYLLGILILLFIFSIYYGIQITYVYKYGAEKGRMQVYIALMIIVILIAGINYLNVKIDLSFLDKFSILIPIILALLIIFNVFISYSLSLKIYSKKEV